MAVGTKAFQVFQACSVALLHSRNMCHLVMHLNAGFAIFAPVLFDGILMAMLAIQLTFMGTLEFGFFGFS